MRKSNKLLSTSFEGGSDDKYSKVHGNHAINNSSGNLNHHNSAS